MQRRQRNIIILVGVILALSAIITSVTTKAPKINEPTNTPTVRSGNTFAITLTAISQITPSITPTPTITPTLSGDTLTVNNLGDRDDGKCDAKDCSLREAIHYASYGTKIVFSVTGSIDLKASLEVNNTNLTIVGPGPKSGNLVIQGNKAQSVFVVGSSATLNLNNMTVSGGAATEGGGINNLGGSLKIADATFQQNFATGGGAIANLRGIVAITNSTFYDNKATGGGAIENDGGDIDIQNSTFYSNLATSAGAILNSRGTILIINCTFNDNSKGGAVSIYNDSVSAQLPGNIGHTPIPSLTLINTIVDGSSGLQTCAGAITDGGNNIQYPHVDCGSSIPNEDPKLGSPQDNGGFTLTLKLLPGSPAIDKGNNSYCATMESGNTDQRSKPRIVGSACDIGAFEYIANLTATASLNP